MKKLIAKAKIWRLRRKLVWAQRHAQVAAKAARTERARDLYYQGKQQRIRKLLDLMNSLI